MHVFNQHTAITGMYIAACPCVLFFFSCNFFPSFGLCPPTCQGLSVDVAGFDQKMADEKVKSNQARNTQKAAGGKAMVLEAEQVKHQPGLLKLFLSHKMHDILLYWSGIERLQVGASSISS